MDQITQQNAGLVEEAAAASQAIVRQISDLNSCIAYSKQTPGSATQTRQAPRETSRPVHRAPAPVEEPPLRAVAMRRAG